MPKKRFLRDVLSTALKRREESERRWSPLTAADLEGEPPVHAVADLVTSWQPRDIRYDPQYAGAHDFTPYDSEEMRTLADGMEVRVISKDISSGTVQLAVDFQSNMDEYDEYNETVLAHNKDWEDQGCPTDVFDPVSGDLKPLKDTYVDPVLPDSKHRPYPKSLLEGVSSGTLAQSRPGMKRCTYVQLTYQVSEDDGIFTLSYFARNMKNQILLYATQEGDDLAALVRSSVQRLWGNPRLPGNVGPFLDGISMLLQGKKTQLSIGTPPGRVKPAIEPAKIVLGVEKTAAKFGHVVFGYIIPAVSFFSFIILIYYCLFGIYGDDPHDMSGPFFGGLAAIAVVVYLSLKLGGYCMTKAEAIRQEEMLI